MFELSLLQVKVKRAATATLLGPVEPLYECPSIVMMSHLASVSKRVAVRVPAVLTRCADRMRIGAYDPMVSPNSRLLTWA